MKQTVLSVLIVLTVFTAGADKMNEQVFKQLFKYGWGAWKVAAKQCDDVPGKNRELLDAMKIIEKKAREKRASSFTVMHDAVTLLEMLQKQLDRVCGKVALVDRSAIETIIVNESGMLLPAFKRSGDFEGFLKTVYNTEYSRLLYLLSMTGTLKKLHNDWARTMAAERSQPADSIENVRKANAGLAREIQKQMIMFDSYYEGKELPTPETGGNNGEKQTDN